MIYIFCWDLYNLVIRRHLPSFVSLCSDLVISAQNKDGPESFIIEIEKSKVNGLLQEFDGDLAFLTQFLRLQDKRMVLINPVSRLVHTTRALQAFIFMTVIYLNVCRGSKTAMARRRLTRTMVKKVKVKTKKTAHRASSSRTRCRVSKSTWTPNKKAPQTRLPKKRIMAQVLATRSSH